MSSFSSFFDKFPELIASECRNIFAIEGMYNHIPEGNYGFIELFCNRPGCDCRTAMIAIVTSEPTSKLWAVLRYGWESSQFYFDWLGDKSELSEKLPGVFLDPGSPDNLLAKEFLSVFTSMIENDKKYAARIETHYQMYRDLIDNEAVDEENRQPYRLNRKKIGRNDPCFCGSSKKYKKCCLQ